MSDNVVPLLVSQGSYLATVALYRMPDGSIRGELTDMPAPVIEGKDTISDRFVALSEWCLVAAIDFQRQGEAFSNV